MVYLLILIAVVAMTAAQLFLKKGVLAIGGTPQALGELGQFFLKACASPYIISALFLGLITALAWIVALSKAELSHVYPFMSLSFVLVALFSLLIFKEDVNALRWVGIIVICVGVFLVSRS